MMKRVIFTIILIIILYLILRSLRAMFITKIGSLENLKYLVELFSNMFLSGWPEI